MANHPTTLLNNALPALLFAGALAAAASAGQETQIANFAFELTPGGTTVGFDAFNDHGGTRMLVNTTLVLEAEVGGSVSTENSQLAASEDVSVYLSGIVAASIGSDMFAVTNFNTQFIADAPVAGTNGQPGGPDLFSFGWLGVWGTDEDVMTGAISEPAGDAQVQASVYGAANFLPDQPYNTWDWNVANFSASGRLILTYEYVDLGTNCTGDINSDGTVGFADLLEVLGAWGNCPVITLCPQDIAPSGMVDAGDLFSVLTNWGSCSGK